MISHCWLPIYAESKSVHPPWFLLLAHHQTVLGYQQPQYRPKISKLWLSMISYDPLLTTWPHSFQMVAKILQELCVSKLCVVLYFFSQVHIPMFYYPVSMAITVSVAVGWEIYSISHYMYIVWCCYNVVNRLPNPHKIHPIAHSVRMRYGVFCGFKLRYIFFPSHCSDVCNIMWYWIML